MPLLIQILCLVLFCYVLICFFIYIFQEKQFFKPSKTDPKYRYESQNCTEVFIPVSNAVNLHGLWFEGKNKQQIIIYLHGYKGNMERVVRIGNYYTSQLECSFFAFDYRGYGKSDGKIQSEKQFMSDAQKVFSYVQKQSPDAELIIMGYSLGTAAATYLAAQNPVKQLILLAPYYNFISLKKERGMYSFPDFLLRYTFKTNVFITAVKAPITIFHGKDDQSIRYTNAAELQQEKPSSILYLLENQGHPELFFNPELLKILQEIIIPPACNPTPSLLL